MSEFKGREKKLENMSGPERTRHDEAVAKQKAEPKVKAPRASPEELKVKHLRDTAYAVQRIKEWAWKVQDKVDSSKHPLTDAQREKISAECKIIMEGIENSLKPKVAGVSKASAFSLDD